MAYREEEAIAAHGLMCQLRLSRLWGWKHSSRRLQLGTPVVVRFAAMTIVSPQWCFARVPRRFKSDQPQLSVDS